MVGSRRSGPGGIGRARGGVGAAVREVPDRHPVPDPQLVGLLGTRVPAPGQPRVAIVRCDGRLVAVAPCYVRRVGPWRVLAPLGGAITHHTDVLVEPGTESAAWRHLSQALLGTPGWRVEADSSGRRNTSIREVCEWDGRGVGLRSRREGPRCGRRGGRRWLGGSFGSGFWTAVAAGLSSGEAAGRCGVSPAVGARWFREGGGMSTVGPRPLSDRYLSFAEREEIALLRAQDVGVREIARRLGRAASTISRELRRDAATRGGRLDYRVSTAQWHADRRPQRRRSPSSARTRPFGSTSRIGSAARSPIPMAVRCQDRR